MDVVTMKSSTTMLEDSCGMAISVGKIRRFLSEQKVEPAATPGDADLSAEQIVAKVRVSTVFILAE